jgi:YD repeat-containing protein
LGRLTSVTEDPGTSPHLNYTTTYAYDLLNDLYTVTQGSQPPRTFNYDMLGRLTSAKTPEAGTVAYSYASSGAACSGSLSALCSRTDARSITTTYAYDTMNRLTSKTYNDGTTPSANFFYDQAPSTMPAWTGVTFRMAKGRMVLTCTNTASGTCTSPSTATAYSYDPLGRTAYFWQCNPSNCGTSSIWETQYTYDWAGDVTWWAHPDTSDAATFTNTVNQAQQITAVQSSLQNSTHPQYLAQNISYTPWGAISTLENGCVGSGCTNTVETYTYNNRLQPWMIQLSTASSGGYCLVYNYLSSWTPPSTCPVAASVPTSGSGNNGNVNGYWYKDYSQSSFSHTASYTYDAVNRLTAAQATGNSTYNQTYAYGNPYGDGSNGQFGNMTCISGCVTSNLTDMVFDVTTNRINMPSSYSYDAAGNL